MKAYRFKWICITVIILGISMAILEYGLAVEGYGWAPCMDTIIDNPYEEG
jgi:hypothetical protein